MPSLANMPFSGLLRLLPVDDHAIEIDADFWNPLFGAAGLARLHAAIFHGHRSIWLSRERLKHFAYATPDQKCAEILLWGYPRNQRGIPARALINLPHIVIAAASMADWPNYDAGFPAGMGPSTTSKFAYFHDRRFGGHPALILDSRVTDALRLWNETAGLGITAYAHMRGGYIDYLKAVHNTAMAIGCPCDAIELFLFSLGQSFY